MTKKINHNDDNNIVCLFAWSLTALSAQIGYIVPNSRIIYHVGGGDNTNT